MNERAPTFALSRGTTERFAARIVESIERFAARNVGDVKKLAGSGHIHRLRVGDWRVIFAFEDEGATVAVSRVLNGRDAYR